MKKIILFLALGLCMHFVACTGEDGRDGIAGVDGKDGIAGVDGSDGRDGRDGTDGRDGRDGKDAYVNLDSIVQVIREEMAQSLGDSLYAKPYVDTIYQILFDNAFAEVWMDSIRQALVDSLQRADYDSLYNKLYDSVYYDIYSQNIIRTLDAYLWTAKDDIYSAFAAQYSLMYKDYISPTGNVHPVPISIKVRNACVKNTSQTPPVPCRYKSILVKAWIEDFTDTSSVTNFVNPDTTELFAPALNFKTEKLFALTTAIKTSIQVRAYALENDREILFYSHSEPTTIHPPQVNGGEFIGVENRNYWDAVWVTPAMDSIENILNEIKSILPSGTLKAYQLYSEDLSISESTNRVVAAVFEVLKKKNIKYIQNNGAGSVGQKINYPIEVLRSKQAVCNEYSFLVASVLEAIGFEVAIISVPSHMFIGYRLEENSNVLGFLETTVLAHETATFEYAYQSAVDRFNEETEAGNFADGTSEIVFLKDARKYGITPNDIK